MNSAVLKQQFYFAFAQEEQNLEKYCIGGADENPLCVIFAKCHKTPTIYALGMSKIQRPTAEASKQLQDLHTPLEETEDLILSRGSRTRRKQIQILLLRFLKGQ